MTGLADFFSSWTIRGRFPDFEPDSRQTALVTGFDEQQNAPVIRVGDTRLFLPGESRDLVDTLVRFEVQDFDPQTHTGEARLLEVLGTPSF